MPIVACVSVYARAILPTEGLLLLLAALGIPPRVLLALFISAAAQNNRMLSPAAGSIRFGLKMFNDFPCVCLCVRRGVYEHVWHNVFCKAVGTKQPQFSDTIESNAYAHTHTRARAALTAFPLIFIAPKLGSMRSVHMRACVRVPHTHIFPFASAIERSARLVYGSLHLMLIRWQMCALIISFLARESRAICCLCCHWLVWYWHFAFVVAELAAARRCVYFGWYFIAVHELNARSQTI